MLEHNYWFILVHPFMVGKTKNYISNLIIGFQKHKDLSHVTYPPLQEVINSYLDSCRRKPPPPKGEDPDDGETPEFGGDDSDPASNLEFENFKAWLDSQTPETTPSDSARGAAVPCADVKCAKCGQAGNCPCVSVGNLIKIFFSSKSTTTKVVVVEDV